MDNLSSDSRSTANLDLKTFLVCGMTGVGKSTFINKATGARLSVSGRIDSDTVDVIEEGIPLIKVGDEYIQLVDTPGFGDSREESETVVLRRISTWLAARYISKLPVTGVLFLRPIYDVRANRLEKALMAMLKDLCGDDCLDHIILVTTRWTSESTEEEKVRESELARQTEFFGSDGAKQVQVRQLKDRCSAEEAYSLIESCTGLPPVTFQIQREVVDEEKTLGQTQAGMRIGADMEEKLSGLEERAKKASELAAAAKRQLEEADQAESRLQQELAREAERAQQAAKDAEEARQAAQAEKERSEKEQREAEENARKAEEARRAAEAEKQRLEKERKEVEERAREAERVLAAQRAAEEERVRLERERAERERIAREQDIGRQAEAFAIAAGQHMHQAAMVVQQQAQQAAIAAQPHVQHAVNETARFGEMVFQATAREWQRHNANCLLM